MTEPIPSACMCTGHYDQCWCPIGCGDVDCRLVDLVSIHLKWDGKMCNTEQGGRVLQCRVKHLPVEENLWKDNDEWIVIWLGLVSGKSKQFLRWITPHKRIHTKSIIASINNSSCLSSILFGTANHPPPPPSADVFAVSPLLMSSTSLSGLSGLIARNI